MMGKSLKNHLLILCQLQVVFQGALFTQASVRSDSRKVSQDRLKFENGHESSLETHDNLLYYLPTESVSDSVQNSKATATSPPHITIDPASVHSMSEPTIKAFAFGVPDLHENDDYIIPYASQCVSDLPANFESEYFSELLTPSKNLVPEPILSGHIEIASKTSTGDSELKDFNRLSGSSVVLEGSHIYMPSVTHSE